MTRLLRRGWPSAALLLILALALLAGCAQPVAVTPAPTVERLALVAPATRTPTPAVVALVTRVPTPLPTPSPTFAPVTGVVVGALDGDTLRVLVGDQPSAVGYAGVDAPPLIEPLGRLAADANAALSVGKLVTLVRMGDDRDGNGRLLRHVFLQDGTYLNGEIVRQGWARVLAPEPGARPAPRLAELSGLQEDAIATGIGIWAAQQGPVTSRPVKLRQGPGPEFPEAETLPTNTPLDLVALSPDGQWFRLATGAWIAAFNVINPPAAGTLELATVPTLAFALETLPPPTFTPTPAPTPTPRPTAALGAILIDTLDKVDEYLILRNATAQPLDLEGWKLQSEAGNQICTLAGVLEAGALLTVWAQTGPLTDFSCAFPGPIWEDLASDAALLWSPDGRVIARAE